MERKIPLDKDYWNKKAAFLKEGDARTAKQLFDHFSKPLYHFFLGKVGRREAAEDLTQSVFLKTIQYLDSFDETKGNFVSWFWQIARHTLIDYYRKSARQEISVEENQLDIVDDRENTETKAQASELLEHLERFEAAERELLIMRHISGLSYKEIGSITGQSPAALRVIVHRLTKKLKKILED